MMTLVTYIGRKKKKKVMMLKVRTMRMRMMMILMIWVIKSCKWRTPLRHLYCPWGADTGRPSRKDLDLDFQQPARRSYEWPGSAKLLTS